jgi:universal stress protein E
LKNPNSVLVILDKPKHGQAALAEALRLQHASGAELRLVSFVWHAMAEQKEVFNASQRRALKREIIRVREGWLRDLILDEGLSGAPVHIEVAWTGDIGGWVARECADFDLVLKSVHRSHTLMHTPLDWQLIRECPKPLLLCASTKPGRRKKAGAAAARDVIATVDLRHQDRKHQTMNLRVLDAAARFVELRGGRLHCVAVVEYSEVLSDLEMIDSRKVQRAQVQASEEFLTALIEPYGIPKARIHRPAGKVGHMVAATARKTGAGLVVVGSAARRGLGARLLGNSAEKILERSPVDVLVVHP